MDGPPPPPPPPHGANPRSDTGPGDGSRYRKSTDLPEGPYDIFIIPPHSAGGGFLYLPSLQCHTNSFLAGVAVTLMGVYFYFNALPTLKTWCATVVARGGMGVFLLAFGIGLVSWAIGKAQAEGVFRQRSRSKPTASSNGSTSRGPPPGPPPGGPPPGGHGPPPPGGAGPGPGAGGGSYQNYGGHYAGAGFPPPPNPGAGFPGGGGPYPGAGGPYPGAGPQYPGGHQYNRNSYPGSRQSYGSYNSPPSPEPHRRDTRRSESPGPPPPPRREAPRPASPPPPPPNHEPRRPETPKPQFMPKEPEPKPEQKPEPPKPEVPKKEEPAPEEPKPAPPQPEAPAPEPPTREIPKPEEAKPEEPKPEPPKPAAPKPEPPKQPEVKPDPPKPAEPAPQPAPQPEPPKPETPKEAPTVDPKMGEWEKAREETRRREELKRKMEEIKRKRAEAERKKKEEEEKKAREEQEKRDKEKREREYRLWKEKRAKEKAAKEAAEREAKAAQEAAEKEAAEKAAKEKARQEAAARYAAAKEAAAARRAAAAASAAPSVAPSVSSTTKLSSTTKVSPVKPKSQTASPEKRSPSPEKRPAPKSTQSKPPFPSVKTATTDAEDDGCSFRPYDRPRSSISRPSQAASVISESTYAPSQSTANTSPPPSQRGPYSTKDPNKIVIHGVYTFNNAFMKTPIAQLVSGVGSVTDGLILRMTTEGMFVDDDVRGVAQREWDIKAWTMKLIEVWCPLHSANGNHPARSGNGKLNPFRFGNLHSSSKQPSSEDSDAFVSGMLHTCKDQCRFGVSSAADSSSSYHSAGSGIDQAILQTAEARGLHIMRTSIRDQDGKRFIFVLDESEAWKVALGLKCLRKGSQVRALGVCGLPANEAASILGNLGY